MGNVFVGDLRAGDVFVTIGRQVRVLLGRRPPSSSQPGFGEGNSVELAFMAPDGKIFMWVYADDYLVETL